MTDEAAIPGILAQAEAVVADCRVDECHICADDPVLSREMQANGQIEICKRFGPKRCPR